MKKILIVANAGGHLHEMSQLLPTLQKFSLTIITEDDNSTKSFVDKINGKAYYFKVGNRKRKIKYLYIFMKNFFFTLKILRKEKPDIILSTGSNLAVPAFYMSKLFKKKLVFIETYANINKGSLSGKLIYPIADLFIVQWETLLKEYPKGVYWGGVY